MSDDTKASVVPGEIPKGRAKGRDAGPALTRAQRTLRDSAIVSALHAGGTTREVAKEFELTPRSVERIRAQFALRGTALDDRPMAIVEEILRMYRQQMHNFAVVAEDTIDRAPAVAIAALKGQADALERYSALLSNIGKLPDNLELFRAESEMLRIGELMIEKVAALEAGEVSAQEVAEFFRAVVTSRAPISSYDAPAEVRELPPGR